MNKHIISKISLIPMSIPADSKIQFFEIIYINGIEKEVQFFEQNGKLEDLISSYKIRKDGDIYDTRALIGKNCLISGEQIIFE